MGATRYSYTINSQQHVPIQAIMLFLPSLKYQDRRIRVTNLSVRDMSDTYFKEAFQAVLVECSVSIQTIGGCGGQAGGRGSACTGGGWEDLRCALEACSSSRALHRFKATIPKSQNQYFAITLTAIAVNIFIGQKLCCARL